MRPRRWATSVAHSLTASHAPSRPIDHRNSMRARAGWCIVSSTVAGVVIFVHVGLLSVVLVHCAPVVLDGGALQASASALALCCRVRTTDERTDTNG